jgi:phosphoglucosamine mutase
MGQLFGTDGIRGKANTYPITPEVALQLGKATAETLLLPSSGTTSRRAVIGKDTRLSGYMLESALTSGLSSMGMNVYLVGPMPTPAVAHLTRSMAAACGIMITASHNPADDNGIKIFNRDGFKLSDELEEQIESLILGDEISSHHIDNDKIGKVYRIEDARGRYIEFAKSTVDNVPLDGLKIVLDCANGAGYFLGPLIFKELGAEVIRIGTEPDGYNINRGCGALYPEQLCRTVLEHGADLGIALDGDADRVQMCDAHGRMVDGDKLLGLMAIGLQEHGLLHNDLLVVTVMSNLGLHKAMHKRGIKTISTQVGDRNVIEEMRRTGAAIGGEQSGHLVFMDYATTGDGIISALQVLRLMVETQKPFAELTEFMTPYPQKLESFLVKEKRPLEELAGVQSVLRDCDDFFAGDGRHLVRYSGTENKVRVLVEAPDAADVEDWCEKICAALRKELCE